MNATYESDELYHFGVKGMKWGIRNTRERASANRRAATNSYVRSRRQLDRERETLRNTKGGTVYQRAARAVSSNPVGRGLQNMGLRQAYGYDIARRGDKKLKSNSGSLKKINNARMDNPDTKRQMSKGKKIAIGLGLLAGGAALAYAGGSGRAAGISKASSSLSSAVSAVKKRGY